MKKLSDEQIKRNVSFTVFIILIVLSFFIFNPAWGTNHKDDGSQEQYCWISGENFHDFKEIELNFYFHLAKIAST